jgi:hypothetical protein
MTCRPRLFDEPGQKQSRRYTSVYVDVVPVGVGLILATTILRSQRARITNVLHFGIPFQVRR